MVQSQRKDDNEHSYYQCKECGFRYKDKEWAEQCAAWCEKHHSCNLEIIQHAIQENMTGGDTNG